MKQQTATEVNDDPSRVESQFSGLTTRQQVGVAAHNAKVKAKTRLQTMANTTIGRFWTEK